MIQFIPFIIIGVVGYVIGSLRPARLMNFSRPNGMDMASQELFCKLRGHDFISNWHLWFLPMLLDLLKGGFSTFFALMVFGPNPEFLSIGIVAVLVGHRFSFLSWNDHENSALVGLGALYPLSHYAPILGLLMFGAICRRYHGFRNAANIGAVTLASVVIVGLPGLFLVQSLRAAQWSVIAAVALGFSFILSLMDLLWPGANEMKTMVAIRKGNS